MLTLRMISLMEKNFVHQHINSFPGGRVDPVRDLPLDPTLILRKELLHVAGNCLIACLRARRHMMNFRRTEPCLLRLSVKREKRSAYHLTRSKSWDKSDRRSFPLADCACGLTLYVVDFPVMDGTVYRLHQWRDRTRGSYIPRPKYGATTNPGKILPVNPPYPHYGWIL